MNDELVDVFSKISSNIFLDIEALSARAILSATPATITALIELKIEFNLTAFPILSEK